MKKSILILLLFSLLTSAFSKPENLRAYFSYSSFFSPEHGPYLETYLSILGSSVVYVKNENGKYQGAVRITMIFKLGDSIRDFRKYDLLSPEVEDTTSINFGFLDQQRIPLPDGKYDMELSIADKNRDKAPFIIKEVLDISFPSNKINISGIELVESYQKSTDLSILSKSGYDFIPYMDNFFPSSINKLVFYSEIYNSAKVLNANEPFLIQTSIQSYETSKVFGNYQKVKRENGKAVNVVFGEFDLNSLPSGNFNLVISVRDKENKELAFNSLFFQRSNLNYSYDLQSLALVDTKNSFANSFQNADSLREFTRMLFPIASADEKIFIRSQSKVAKLDVLQQFFHTFWLSRNDKDPASAWNTYYEQVLAVNEDFKTVNKKGYETDRGRVYLQFGPPNTRTQSYDEPRAYPYEIWQYYKLGIQSNRKFVFFAREYASGDFELLHSDAKGEVVNPRWEIALHTRDTDRYQSPQLIDRMTEDPHWGNHTTDYYNLPR